LNIATIDILPKLDSLGCIFITALHGMQGGLVRRKLFVCLSVRPSVCQTRALGQNRRKIFQIFIRYERSFSI